MYCAAYTFDSERSTWSTRAPCIVNPNQVCQLVRSGARCYKLSFDFMSISFCLSRKRFQKLELQVFALIEPWRCRIKGRPSLPHPRVRGAVMLSSVS